MSKRVRTNEQFASTTANRAAVFESSRSYLFAFVCLICNLRERAIRKRERFVRESSRAQDISGCLIDRGELERRCVSFHVRTICVSISGVLSGTNPTRIRIRIGKVVSQSRWYFSIAAAPRILKHSMTDVSSRAWLKLNFALTICLLAQYFRRKVHYCQPSVSQTGSRTLTRSLNRS